MDTEGHRPVLRGRGDYAFLLRQRSFLFEERHPGCNLVSICVRGIDNYFFQTKEDRVSHDRTFGFVWLVVSDFARSTHRIGMDSHLVIGCVPLGTGYLADKKISRYEAGRF